jgi:hypothetical protein
MWLNISFYKFNFLLTKPSYIFKKVPPYLSLLTLKEPLLFHRFHFLRFFQKYKRSLAEVYHQLEAGLKKNRERQVWILWIFVVEQVAWDPGMPDFSWHMIPKPEIVYKMNTKCTRWSKKSQMSVKFSKWT